MSKKVVLATIALCFAACFFNNTSASALRIAPLTYDIQLEPGQKKKGRVDITNTSPVTQKYTFSVQAFEQIDSTGSLSFYDNKQLTEGIALDYDELDIQAGQTLRLAFLVDSAKLPAGDSFASIFATASPVDQAAAGAVRVGTILTILNGAPNGRAAEITSVQIPFWQIGREITGSYKVKNTSDPKKSTGFRPLVDLSVSPFSQQAQHRSSLVFAGIERSNDFKIATTRFGFYKVRVGYGTSHQESWVFFATPWGLATATGLMLLIGASTYLLMQRRRIVARLSHRHTPSR